MSLFPVCKSHNSCTLHYYVLTYQIPEYFIRSPGTNNGPSIEVFFCYEVTTHSNSWWQQLQCNCYSS